MMHPRRTETKQRGNEARKKEEEKKSSKRDWAKEYGAAAGATGEPRDLTE